VSPELVTANKIARTVIANLKSGVLLQGTVCSLYTGRAMNIAWVGFELPGIGERQVAVKNENDLQLGQEVVLECVPNPFRPGHYLFRIASGPPAPLLCHVSVTD
jgi:hypothetical protein